MSEPPQRGRKQDRASTFANLSDVPRENALRACMGLPRLHSKHVEFTRNQMLYLLCLASIGQGSPLLCQPTVCFGGWMCWACPGHSSCPPGPQAATPRPFQRCAHPAPTAHSWPLEACTSHAPGSDLCLHILLPLSLPALPLALVLCPPCRHPSPCTWDMSKKTVSLQEFFRTNGSPATYNNLPVRPRRAR